MSDLRTVWRDQGGDWTLQGPALEEDGGLETAVVLSLFTDRLADDGQAPQAQRRGWWGDASADLPGDMVGSRLWLLAREKQTPQVLARAEQYSREALLWLVDDGVATSVDVVAQWLASGLLALEVTIKRSAAPVAQYRFEAFWKGA